MTHAFDKQYWEQHWQRGGSGGAGFRAEDPPNPYLARELGELAPRTALDAGCGTGAEAIWLATHGWKVTAADISSEALARAAERATSSGAAELVEWIEADLSVWDPGRRFDLVTTHYAHPAMPQLEFYDRLASWVSPGGTLLIVGHRDAHGAGGEGHGDRHHRGHGHGDGQHGHHGHQGHQEHQGHDHRHVPPAEASATAATVTARLDDATWAVVTAEECHRTLIGHDGREVTLQDVVVRAVRRP